MTHNKHKPFSSGTANVSFGTSGIGSSYQVGQIDRLLNTIQKLQDRIKYLEKKLNNVNDINFSEKDLKFILMKCHPDKNPDSKQAIELTKKLLKMRK